MKQSGNCEIKVAERLGGKCCAKIFGFLTKKFRIWKKITFSPIYDDLTFNLKSFLFFISFYHKTHLFVSK
jgi:hypothetical protein